MPRLTLYTRPGCHLCEVVLDVLEEVRREVPFALDEVNIDEDPAAHALYRHEIPVVTIDGRKAFKYRVDPAELRRRLANAEAGRYAPCTPPDAESAPATSTSGITDTTDTTAAAVTPGAAPNIPGRRP